MVRHDWMGDLGCPATDQKGASTKPFVVFAPSWLSTE
jgi:hypothetical protein